MCNEKIKIKDIMIKEEDLLVAEPEDKVAAVILRMIRRGIGGIPIVDEDECVGVITMRDIMFANFYGGGKLPISEIMTKDLVTINPEDTLLDGINLMLEYKIERLPVVKNGVLKGLVVRNTLLRAVKEASES